MPLPRTPGSNIWNLSKGKSPVVCKHDKCKNKTANLTEICNVHEKHSKPVNNSVGYDLRPVRRVLD